MPPESATAATVAVPAPGSLLDEVRLAVFVLDGAGHVVLWSPEAERLFGHPADRVLGEPAESLLVPARLRRAVRGWFERTWAGPSWAGVLPALRADGTTLQVEIRSRRLTDPDGAARILAHAADTTTVRRLETDLAMSASLINQSPIGLALFDTELRWLRVNPALERLNGIPADALLGRRFGEVLGDTDVRDVESAIRHVMATGEPLLDHRTTGRTPADPGHDHVWSVSYYRVDDPAGRTIGVAASAIDVTERQRANAEVAAARERLAVIADSGTRVGTTLDLPRTARELAEVVVPRLADLAAVDILDPVLGGESAPAAPPAGAARFRTLAVIAGGGFDAGRAAYRIGEPTSHGPDHVLTRCVRQARPVLLPRADAAALCDLARDDEAAAVFRDIGVHSALTVPLVARGEVLGTLGLLRAGNPRPFDQQDLSLATELAARAAVSVDNARLYGRERAIALTLQHSLLPRLTGGHGGLDIACRYRPAVHEVGGDWFDVLRLADGRIGLVVGDVMGKGVRAAAIMGQLRSTIRALARLDLPPGELLGHLDDIATFLGDAIATCVYAVCDPRDGWCELSSAGHLPPALVGPDGTAHLLELDSAVPLGVGGQPFTTERRRLAAGSTLALFTDGLVEERGAPIDAGLDAVLRVLAGPPRPLEETCDALLHGLGRTTPEDDVALLLARMPPRARAPR
ncbi:SpoIIE family protein phosphatase [Streptomyces litchfieldiae]|uniref:SpoIIE family protein phosphatase n=1 Tax=Streptomyces litchfieldiae TaxID=3075543 RepID=A0ABU2MQM5_9ACTN|nr:SpoIIE family protein phosphatase [Streptomyces sp. DSM 44938]MDT0343815.1 SpoIIE family protein phosphatase [Streptomyces sp. DSM 44938]